VVAVLVALALGAAFLWLPRRYAPVLPVLVAAGFLATWLPVELWTHSFPRLSRSAYAQGIGAGKSWIDRAAGPDADVAVLWSGGNRYTVWQNEFWNRSVRRVYSLGSTMSGGLPAVPVSIGLRDRATGILRDRKGRELLDPYVLTSSSVTLVGRRVAADPAKKLVLYRVSVPVRVTTRIVGLYPERANPWSSGRVVWSRSECRPGTLTAVVSSDALLFSGTTQTLTVGGTTPAQTLRLPPTTSQRQLTLPLTPREGVCRVTFAISPTRRPVDFRRMHSTDTRSLGLHFNALHYTPHP
jgi:hypothetical protein